MNATLYMGLPPTATDVSDQPFDPTDDAFAGVINAADTELVAVLTSDLDGFDFDDDFDTVSLDELMSDEPPTDWEDYTTDDYRMFVGL